MRRWRRTGHGEPEIVVITDRNDLDDQLFGTFARCRDLLRQDPVQAVDRADLREKLRVAGGGVVFTTIQKLMPAEQGDRNAVLSDRGNIVVIADYISIYDITRAVEDGATMPIYYEGRLASLELSEAERPKIAPDFEEVTEGAQSRHDRLRGRSSGAAAGHSNARRSTCWIDASPLSS